MTTIAWDSRTKTMVGDRRSAYHGNGVTKVRRIYDGALVGFAGCVETALAALDWVEVTLVQTGGRLDGPGVPNRPDLSEPITLLVVLPDGRALYCHEKLRFIPVSGPHFAIGSGGGYAMGAMAFGATALEAVRIAAHYDDATGSEFDVEQLA